MNTEKLSVKDVFAQRRQQLLALQAARAGKNPRAGDPCPHCGKPVTRRELAESLQVCPHCGYHHRIGAYYRLQLVLDSGSFQEVNARMTSSDPWNFPGYGEKLKATREHTGLNEAVVTALGLLDGRKVAAIAMDSQFFMGSMSACLGEKVTRLIEHADKNHLPLLLFSASGGARMQEGILSLMQMAKTAAAMEHFSRSGNLSICVMTDPTTGGVTASFASLGDIILAEPGALIGFAGPRVIQQTIGQTLPEGFQTSEYMLRHGMVDAIVPRCELKSTLSRLLALHDTHGKSSGGRRKKSREELPGLSSVYRTPIERLALARHTGRPGTADYIAALCTDFVELKGDRQGCEDPAVLGGLALFHGRPVTVIGHRKGKNLEENVACNFGMPGPEGYRKALRLMEQAEKFHRPILTFIDTPGAYPGVEAEANGQGEAIARCLATMSALTVPVVCVVIGEGNSGGALAIGVGNTVLMLENAVYAVLSPEGFATILWKDSSRAAEACDVMHLTAFDLQETGVIDGIIPEPPEGAHADPNMTFRCVDHALVQTLEALQKLSGPALAAQRYRKFRRMGDIHRGSKEQKDTGRRRGG